MFASVKRLLTNFRSKYVIYHCRIPPWGSHISFLGRFPFLLNSHRLTHFGTLKWSARARKRARKYFKDMAAALATHARRTEGEYKTDLYSLPQLTTLAKASLKFCRHFLITYVGFDEYDLLLLPCGAWTVDSHFREGLHRILRAVSESFDLYSMHDPSYPPWVAEYEPKEESSDDEPQGDQKKASSSLDRNTHADHHPQCVAPTSCSYQSQNQIRICKL